MGHQWTKEDDVVAGKSGILEGVDAVIDRFLKVEEIGTTSPHYRHKQSCLHLSQQPLVELDSQAFINSLYEIICRNWERSRQHYEKPPSQENWRQTRHPDFAPNNSSSEVTLERTLIQAMEETWINQVPTSSGLTGPYYDKARNIDLVHDLGRGVWEFVELKVNSDTPLYATMEVLLYGLLFVFSQRNQQKLGYDPSNRLLAANRVHLKVLAPSAYYSRNQDGERYHFQWLEESLNEGLKGFLSQGVPSGLQMDFQFEAFPPHFLWPLDSTQADGEVLRTALQHRYPVYGGTWQTRSRIEDNLFPLSHAACEPWEEFPWHIGPNREIDTHLAHSSQALAIDVFGAIQKSPSRDVILDALAENLGLPPGGPWTVNLEWVVPRSLLNEQRSTQVDVRLESPHAVLLCECKFTEQNGGGCSQTLRRRGVPQCNGHYEQQTNPLNNVASRCALSGKGIRYWEVIPEVFALDREVDHQPCPFAGPTYQWMRNLISAYEYANTQGKRPGVAIVYADAPDLPMAKEVRSPEWGEFVQTVKQEQVIFKTLSYQEIVKLACDVVGESDGDEHVWRDLADWVDRKIGSVSAYDV